jgi:hypothetical protein
VGKYVEPRIVWENIVEMSLWSTANERIKQWQHICGATSRQESSTNEAGERGDVRPRAYDQSGRSEGG